MCKSTYKKRRKEKKKRRRRKESKPKNVVTYILNGVWVCVCTQRKFWKEKHTVN